MTTATFVDFYDILAQPETADPERIKKAIRDQRRIWNKRAAQSDPVQKHIAEARIRDLAEAERLLLNPQSRSAYDSTRSQNKARAAAESAATGEPTGGARRDWLTEAQQLFASGNAHAANYAAREAIAVNGADHQAWNIRANSSFLLSNYADAGFEFREAIRLQPHNPSYHFDYGEAHAATGKWADALAEYEIALQQAPGDSVYKTAIANVYLNTKRAPQALEIMESVVNSAPGVEVFQYYLALALHDANLEKWSRSANGKFVITSPAQIAVTREMSGRALSLKFTDPMLRSSLEENLQLADRAETQKWTRSLNMQWYLGGLVVAVILLFSGVSASASVLGFFVAAGLIAIYVLRHYKPGWKVNAASPGIQTHGI